MEHLFSVALPVLLAFAVVAAGAGAGTPAPFGVAAMDIAGEGPRRDLAGLPSQSLTVALPPGHAMRLTVMAEGATLDTVPMDDLRGALVPGRGCATVVADVKGWVRSEMALDCDDRYASHGSSIDGISIVLAGQGHVAADALSFTNFGYFFLACTGPLAIQGVEPLPNQGSCHVFGSLAGFASWDAFVTIESDGVLLAMVNYD